LGSPGRSTDDGFNEKNCKEILSDNNCVEQCLLDKFKGGRPYYSVIPGVGTQCQQYARNIMIDCKFKCKCLLDDTIPPFGIR
jgi:hypothetical protein